MEENNTALLWSLLAHTAEWSMQQGRDAPDGAAKIAVDARQHSNLLTNALARNPVHPSGIEGLIFGSWGYAIRREASLRRSSGRAWPWWR
jgi:hypothetical protein